MHCKLVRIFFRSGVKETRPLDWVVFYDVARQVDDGSKFVTDIEGKAEKLSKDEELLFVNIQETQAIQVYNGEFTQRGEHNGRDDPHGSRR